jgi:glycosyltransferase involved in cell wall biosynthesis
VVQIGPLPPPYGGVSVHLRRLASLLSERGVRVVVFCQEGADAVPGVEIIRLARFSLRGWLHAGGLRLDARVVHCHVGWYWSPALLMAAVAGSRVVVTVHSEDQMDSLARYPWYHRLASRLLFASPRARWIAVNAHIGEELVRRGARAENVAIAPAYLPTTDEAAGFSTLPDELRAFASGHHPLLTVYGWRADAAEDGTDVYGFDLAIEALTHLRAIRPWCGLVVLVPSGEPADRVSAMRREIEERGLGDSACLWSAPLADPTPLWLATDVYLRPSRTDGDAVSVREVLALGGTVVASDCSCRPTGVRLFASGDAGALGDAVLAAISAPAATARSDSDTSGALRALEHAYDLPLGSLAGRPQETIDAGTAHAT